MKKTMRDIAKTCGVSISLVSRIINGDTSLKCRQETRERVLLEIERTSFVPDTNARALANSMISSKKDISIGYITYKGAIFKMNPYFDRVIEGIVSALSDSNCQVYKFYIDEVVECYKNGKPLCEKRLDGLILFGEIGDKRLIKYFHQQAKYLSSIYGDEIDDADFVGSNVLTSMDSMLDYIKGCGYSKIGLITGGDTNRINHILSYINEIGLEIDDNYFFVAKNESNTAYELVKEKLKQYPVPQLLCCMNDEMAIGAMNACLDAGLRIPDDIAITGHDDILKSNYSRVPLTTVHIFKKEIGQLVAELLLERLKNKRKFAVKLYIPCELSIRESMLKKRQGE